jgi:hypothetical protein
MSYRQILYQIVVGTKNRESAISEAYSHEIVKRLIRIRRDCDWDIAS